MSSPDARAHASPPRDGHLRGALRLGILEGGAATVSAVLLSGAFLTGYALLIGASDLHLGVLGAIPMVAGLPGLLGAWLAERLRSRRRVVTTMALAGRTLWLSLLLIPSLPLPPEARVWTFVALFGLAALIQGAISTPWMSWMSDLAPARLRGRFWARRNQFIALVNMGVLLGGGCLIDGAEALGHKLWGYYILVIVAYASGLVSIRLLGRTHEPPMKPAPGGGFLANARRPLRDKTFRRLIPAVATFQLGLGLAGAFVSAYMLKTLDLSYTAIGLYTILGQAAGIAGNWFWGPMLDRVGVKPVTLCCLLFVGIVPFLWVSCDFLGWPMIVFNWLFSGFAWAGFGLGMVNFPFALSPKDGRSYYLSVLGSWAAGRSWRARCWAGSTRSGSGPGACACWGWTW